MGVEEFLDKEFEKYAAWTENDVKGKKYSYIILNRNFDRTDKIGICTIERVRYDRIDDSNHYPIKDVDTGETHTLCQFYLELKELDNRASG